VTGLTTPAEDLLRELAPQVLGTAARRYGDFGAAEDAVQEALLAAATHWPEDGVPDNPRGWLIQAASRALTDQYRSDTARRRRELAGAEREPAPAPVSGQDDTLLPPGADPGVGRGAYAARGGRPDHRGDRGCVPGARGDHGAADQPG
jgi:DNA-directed RNA polymerase specialized sigma24 family protein